jgi:CBS domain containing-hemolysin-like protein
MMSDSSSSASAPTPPDAGTEARGGDDGRSADRSPERPPERPPERSPERPPERPPERSAERASERPPERWFERLMAAVGLRPASADLRESLEEVLADEAATGDGFSASERELLRNILRLRETRVEDVMVPRSEIAAVADDITLNALLATFAGSAHSRLPVYRETLDDANAMVHIRDVVDYMTRAALTEAGDGYDFARLNLDASLAAAGLMRPVLSVPGTMPATDLLARMQAAHIQMALVIDEFGGVDGLVSMEDIVETVVGDIEDEHDIEDDDVPDILVLGPEAWSIDGLAELDRVSAVTGIDLASLFDDEEEPAETLGGVVFALAGTVPPVGTVVTREELPGVAFEVLEADSRRVRRVAVRRQAA